MPPRHRPDEPFRATMTKQPVHETLLARINEIKAAKQATVGTIRQVTFNEILKDLLDNWDQTARLVEDVKNHE
jgi:hypothetical protein